MDHSNAQQVQESAALQLTQKIVQGGPDEPLLNLIEQLREDYEVAEKIARCYGAMYEGVKDDMLLEGLSLSDALTKHASSALPEGLLSAEFIARIKQKESEGALHELQ
ncbi:MAG: hypothetical protein AB8H80_04870 [Planctomycetota bacterium]